jgi:hypothetical protein
MNTSLRRARWFLIGLATAVPIGTAWLAWKMMWYVAGIGVIKEDSAALVEGHGGDLRGQQVEVLTAALIQHQFLGNGLFHFTWVLILFAVLVECAVVFSAVQVCRASSSNASL